MKKLLQTCSLTLVCGIVLSASAKTVELKQTNAPRMEVCFVLDTTGSMSGLIEGAKQKIWSIANEMISAKPRPDIKIGLVGYRDRGDEYIEKHFALTNDIDAIYSQLQSFKADGGGDTPESVNEALDVAVNKMSWSQDASTLKIIFLVGDAPPHMDYDGPKYPAVCTAAVKKNIFVNTVQCGTIGETTPVWQEIAKLSEGNYAAIAQSGNMAAIPTPMDGKLAELNRKVGTTLVAYGSVRARSAVMAKQTASEAAPAAVAADRLYFNYNSSKTVQGNGELLDALKDGDMKLADIKKDQLPEEWQKLSETDLKAAIDKKQKERADIQAEIAKLSQERETFIAAERKRLATTGKTDSFDEKVAETIRTEAARKGIVYSTK